MATDLRRVFFQAVERVDAKLLGRLLFATPNLAAGLQRLTTWTATRDELDLGDNSKCPILPAGYAAQLDALSVALLTLLCDKSATISKSDRVNVARLIVSAMPAEQFSRESVHRHGNFYLHLAVMAGAESLVADLLAKGHAVDVEDSNGATAASLCAAEDAAIRALLQPQPPKVATSTAMNMESSVGRDQTAAEEQQQAAMIISHLPAPKPCRIIVTEQPAPLQRSASTVMMSTSRRAAFAATRPSLLSASRGNDTESATSAPAATTTSSGSVASLKLKLQQQQLQPKEQSRRNDLPTTALGDIRQKLAADIQHSLVRAKSQRQSAVVDTPTAVQQPPPPVVVQDASGRVKAVKERIMHGHIRDTFSAPADTPAATLPAKEASGSSDTIADLITSTMAMAVVDGESEDDAIKQFSEPVAVDIAEPVNAEKDVAQQVEDQVPITKLITEEPAKVPETTIEILTATKVNVGVRPTVVKKADPYDTLYLKNFKGPVMVLQDEDDDRPPSPKKNVHFGNSWKGNLEKHQKFLTGASVSSLTKSQVDLYLQHVATNSMPTTFGKLIINILSIRGLVLNYARVPDNVQMSCMVRGPQQTYQTKPFLFNPLQSYTEIPMHEQFGFDVVDGNATVQVELMVRFELKKKRSSAVFNPKAMLQRSSGSLRQMFRPSSSAGWSSRPGSRFSSVTSPAVSSAVDDASSFVGSTSGEAAPVYDDCVCRVKFRLRELVAKCQGAVLDRNWSWEIAEKEPARPASLLTRSSSRLYQAKHYLLAKVHQAAANVQSSSVSASSSSSPASRRPPAPPKNGVCEVAESGHVQMQLLYVGDCQTADEQATIPHTVHDAQQWLASKQWHETIWHSGYLSQQGGDVKFWRRRYFTIVGAKMEAYHEFSMEHRTTIDLTQLQNVKSLHGSMDSSNYPIKNSFRLTFKHGECIDFYASAQADTQQWMRVFQRILVDMPEVPVWMGTVPAATDLPAEEAAAVAPVAKPKKQRRNVTKPMMGKLWSSDDADANDSACDVTLGTPSTVSNRSTVGIFGGRA